MSDSSSDGEEELRRIYEKQLKKEKAKAKARYQDEKLKEKEEERGDEKRRGETRRRSRERGDSRRYKSNYIKSWAPYPAIPYRNWKEGISERVLKLPIYGVQMELLNAVVNNQVVVITGETGSGKSTQVPRILSDYLTATKGGKVICVQPRRLGVMNLHYQLERELGKTVGYHIRMDAHFDDRTKVLLVTAGLFLQRLVHSPYIMKEFPVVVLDEVHERDVDTDFILLTIKRLLPRFPASRLVLMSATIDNSLFRYYFAEDEVAHTSNHHFYKQLLSHQSHESYNEDEIHLNAQLQFLKAERPCPLIQIAAGSRFTRQLYYLNTIPSSLFNRNRVGFSLDSVDFGSYTLCNGLSFNSALPVFHRQLVFFICGVMEELFSSQGTNPHVILVFLPGIAYIYLVLEQLKENNFPKGVEILQAHSTLLTPELVSKLQGTHPIGRVILATNIAYSSITVKGVDFVIDFCLCREVQFEPRSRMERLYLMWASRASCEQRAGRTGRVCDGMVLRLIPSDLFSQLASYATPELQRTSLDKLVLRIKLLEQDYLRSNTRGRLFQDPGEVLGSAIQPPLLRRIDASIKFLLNCGALEHQPMKTEEDDVYREPLHETKTNKRSDYFPTDLQQKDSLRLTPLGRIYVYFPLDITLTRLLLISLQLGTYPDALVVTAILAHSRPPFRRNVLKNNSTTFYDFIDDGFDCDFYNLLRAYRLSYQGKLPFRLDTFHDTKLLIRELNGRVYRLNISCFKIPEEQVEVMKQHLFSLRPPFYGECENECVRFQLLQLTLAVAFIYNLLIVKEPILEDKRYKRLTTLKQSWKFYNGKTMEKYSKIDFTVYLLGNPHYLQNIISDEWRERVNRECGLHSFKLVSTQSCSFIQFYSFRQLRRFLFFKHLESRGELNEEAKKALCGLGEIDCLALGNCFSLQGEYGVMIDTLSINRVVPLTKGKRVLVAHGLNFQRKRMNCHYTSLLSSYCNWESLLPLLFNPFSTLLPNKTISAYQYIQVGRTRIKLDIILTQPEIDYINTLRSMLRSFLLTQELKDNYLLLLIKCLTRIRTAVTDYTWRQLYADEIKEQKWYIPSYIGALLQCSDSKPNFQKPERKQFLGELGNIYLREDFFTGKDVGGWNAERRRENYLAWKQNLMQRLKSFEEETHAEEGWLGCVECGGRVGKLQRVGPVTGNHSRRVRDPEWDNLKEVPFDYINSYFCSLLLVRGLAEEFKVMACLQGHPLAVRIDYSLYILPFSPLVLLMPDGSTAPYHFDRLDSRHWLPLHADALRKHIRHRGSLYCPLCSIEVNSGKEVAKHIKEPLHASLVLDFVSTLNP